MSGLDGLGLQNGLHPRPPAVNLLQLLPPHPSNLT